MILGKEKTNRHLGTWYNWYSLINNWWLGMKEEVILPGLLGDYQRSHAVGKPINQLVQWDGIIGIEELILGISAGLFV